MRGCSPRRRTTARRITSTEVRGWRIGRLIGFLAAVLLGLAALVSRCWPMLARLRNSAVQLTHEQRILMRQPALRTVSGSTPSSRQMRSSESPRISSVWLINHLFRVPRGSSQSMLMARCTRFPRARSFQRGRFCRQKRFVLESASRPTRRTTGLTVTGSRYRTTDRAKVATTDWLPDYSHLNRLAEEESLLNFINSLPGPG